MDVLTPEQRRINMQRIRSMDTRIEIILRKALWKKGYRFRKNYRALPGSPDIALTKYKIAVFCDSEFFHGKDWELKKQQLQKSERADYWISKIEKNIQRDKEKDQELLFLGWTPIHFWGEDIKKNTNECILAIEQLIFEKEVMQKIDYD